jgi:predicted O-methyltransferase YrrM
MAKSKTQNPNHTTLSGEALLDEYVLSHSDPEPDYLYRLWRATNIHMLHGRMASGRLQGRLLKMLVQMVRPRNVLEVGTFSGYSALCMAEGLKDIYEREKQDCYSPSCEEGSTKRQDENRRIYTFEINDEQEPFTRHWIEQSPWADYISFIIGDAAVEAEKLGVKFDMAFLDGDKRTYVETYEAILPLMTQGAIILADNTLWDGHVIDSDYDKDQQTQGIRRFNDHIANDSRVTRVILPLRDGLTIIRKA